MHSSSVYVLLSCILLLSPLSASNIHSVSIHSSDSNPYSDISPFPPVGEFQPPDSENFIVPPPPPYQDDTLGSPPTGDVLPGSPQLPFVQPPSPPIDDTTPTPQLPIILPPPSDGSLPASPQLPFASPPTVGSIPQSPQLPFASSPPLYNTLPGSPHSPLAYHHPIDTQPSTSISPAPFGVYPSGQNQGQQFGQANSGLSGQQQDSNNMPFGGQYGGCSSTVVNLIGTTIVLFGLLLISWV